MAAQGLGPTRVQAELLEVSTVPHSSNLHGGQLDMHANYCQIDLLGQALPFNNVTVNFTTPCELKGFEPSPNNSILLPFRTLFSRILSRLTSLAHFYDGLNGELSAPLRAILDSAALVRTVSQTIQPWSIDRTSRSQSRSHGVGGWIGSAVFMGDLRPYIPVLVAGGWAGVGRHTVWGNGAIKIEN